MPRIAALLPLLLAALPLAAQEAAPVRDLADVDAPPAVQNVAELREALAAGYPPELREAGVAGTVIVAFVVGADGAVREPQVVDAPHELLGAATVEAVRVLRFAPAMLDGAPVDVRVTLPVQWQAAPPPEEPKAPDAGAEMDEGLRKLLEDDPSLVPLARDAVELGVVERAPRVRNPQAMTEVMRREYPAPLRDAGTSGRVVVRFVVDVDGRPQVAYVREVSDPGFAAPTLRAVQLLRFDPARVDGEPVPVWVELPVQWSVSPSPAPSRHADPAFPDLPNAGAGGRSPRSVP